MGKKTDVGIKVYFKVICQSISSNNSRYVFKHFLMEGNMHIEIA